MDLGTAFLIGLIGSFHCVGMCGPIALSLPYQSDNRWQTAGNTMLYNLGRVVTYSLLGLVFGLLGEGVVVAGYQQFLSIFLGVLMLLAAFSMVDFEKKIISIPFVHQWIFKIKMKLATTLKKPKNKAKSLLIIGILNGFLPCGLVYIALAGAVSAGGIPEGGVYMAVFGLGTFPLMLSTSLAGNFVSLNFRRKLQQLIPIFLFAFALLFIVRGLNLGIPYLSPEILPSTPSAPPICH